MYSFSQCLFLKGMFAVIRKWILDCCQEMSGDRLRITKFNDQTQATDSFHGQCLKPMMPHFCS